MNRAVLTLQYLLKAYSLPATVPVHLFGASSGGAFVGRLAQQIHNYAGGSIKIASAVIQIMPVRIDPTELKLSGSPGLMFMHMIRDESSSSTIKELVSRLNSPTVQEIVIPQLKLSPSYFFDHGKHLSQSDSAILVSALKSEGYLSEDMLLREDPRQSAWRDTVTRALPHIVPKIDSLIADESGISELLNLAYSLHEISDYETERVLAFMKSMEH
jgi:hypothetical protein